MRMAERMEVRIKSGVTLRAMRACSSFDGGVKKLLIASGAVQPEGFNHRPTPNVYSNIRCVPINAYENRLLRNVSSPTNLQLTVHLYMKTRENSNALVT